MLVLAWILASPGAAERLLTRTYTTVDGLASERAQCLVTDREGFLWIGTPNGLSRFDGHAFTHYHTASGLPNLTVNHVLHARDGTRWVATNGGGIARLEADTPSRGDRVFTAFPVGDTRASMRVNVLFETAGGELLAGTDAGLFRSPHGRADPRFAPLVLAVPGVADRRLQIWSIVEDSRHHLWIGTSAGLVRLTPEGEVVGHTAVAPVQGADHVLAIAVDDGGRLWLGHDRGLIVWMPPEAGGRDPAQPERPSLRAASTPCLTGGGEEGQIVLPGREGNVCRWRPPQATTTVGLRPQLRTEDGTLWMTSAAGLIAFDGEGFHLYSEPQGVPDTHLTALAADPGGDLWLGTLVGVVHILRQGFTHWTDDDGLAERLVNRIFEGGDGTLYAVTPNSYIHRFAGDRWIAVRPNLPADVGRGGRSRYGAALLDHTGTWWMGSGEGLFRFPAVDTLERLARIAPRAHYTTADGLAGDDVWHLYEDARGDVWIASRIPGRWSLTRWHREAETFERFGPEHGLPDGHAVTSFAEDRAGRLWIGLWDGGLGRFEGAGFRFFPPGSGAPDSGPRPEGSLPPEARGGTYVYADHEGGIWVTVDGRLLRVTEGEYTSPVFTLYPELPGTRNDRVHQILAVTADGGGSLFLSTSRGFSRLRPESGSYQTLGTGPPFAHLRQAHIDRHGTFWFAGRDGVLRLKPRPRRPRRRPQARIEGLRVAGVPRPVPPMGAVSLPPLRLDSSQRQIRIDYSALAFGPDQPLRFQVRLDGADEEWSPPGAQSSVLYAGLGSGDYRFQVRAVGVDGQVSPQPATVSFTIPPPVWRRAWFLALLVAAVATLLAAAHRLRVRRLVEVERMRTRIATDLHDDLGASLARISVLSEVGRRRVGEDVLEASRLFTEIGQVARGLVATAGDIAYAIDPGRGGLNDLVARVRRVAAELLEPSGIAHKVTVDGDGAAVESLALSSEQRRHLLACLKEVLRNAIQHADPRQVRLSFRVEDGTLTVAVADDGRGFEAEFHGATPKPAAHHGLDNMKRRLTELGGGIEIDSRPGEGARLTLRVPI